LSDPKDILTRMYKTDNSELVLPKEETDQKDAEDILQSNIFNVYMSLHKKEL
jgi:hypothetical protein